jgi:ATP-dependent helicase/nuclease subunit A
MAKKINPDPPDKKERDRIVSELDKTVLVEAAAGTGKTAGMVNRMIALVAEGKCRIENIAAVTFTRKAAAELRLRFQVELERASREADSPKRETLADALEKIDRCFIGTIHSFCARLLRERPVEAGVDPEFQEIDEKTDDRLRSEAWSEYIAQMYAAGDSILADLEKVGIKIGDLAASFRSLAEYPDVEEWPSSPQKTIPEFERARAPLLEYARHIEDIVPTLPVSSGNDNLMPKHRYFLRMMQQNDIQDPVQVVEILEQFGEVKVVQKNWPNGKDQALNEQARWEDFYKAYARPLVAAWREYRYNLILQAIEPAIEIYERLRQSQGALNYQDLLMQAAALLRDKRHIRRYFRKRFTHILVDEFQDTDPIQAEVMLLLTAGDAGETDWRKCRPVPGSLFVVGDPKQSIYRFRRADIVTYEKVKSIIINSGGTVVRLSANFRAQEALIDWVNEVFKDEFPKSADDFSPEYVGLLPGRTGRTGGAGAAGGRLAGVKKLLISKTHRKKEQIREYEADLIARFIRNAIDKKLALPRTAAELARGVSTDANPGDFMIVTYKTEGLSDYAARLGEYGIPHQVTGGTTLNQVPELALLQCCLKVLTEPDNPVVLAAVLRGELFGIGDDALYAFKRAGGQFSFRSQVPGDLDREHKEAFEDAFGRMKKYAGWLAQIPPVAAIEKIAADLGLFTLACLFTSGALRAGSLAKAMEIVRAAQAESWTVVSLVEFLEKLVNGEEKHDGLPVRPDEGPAVRIMNLHKAKGLEAPVVFLADPTGKSNKHRVSLHVDRSEDRVKGYMAVWGPDYGQREKILAHPERWESLEKKEQRFLDAEKLRLMYVAATRAGSMLCITQRETYNNYNPWQFFREDLKAVEEIEDPGDQRRSTRREKSIGVGEADAAFSQIRERWQTVTRPSYKVSAAKSLAISSVKFSKALGEHGTEWGTVIHRLLQIAMQKPDADLRFEAKSALQEEELDASLAGDAAKTVAAVMQSDIWRRARAAKRALAEAPFYRLIPAAGDKKSCIVRGYIDLAFQEEDGGWVIVDYKTDDLKSRDIEELSRLYAPQVEIYAESWQEVTKEPVKEKGLYFTSADRYIKF